MPRDRIWTYAIVAAVLAVIGWIWSLTNYEMPDVLWLLTVALSIVAIALALYAIVRGRGSTATTR